MSQNAGVIGKLILLGGSALVMIGRCASKGDDIFRAGARGFDDVTMVSDDAFRYGDDFLRNTDGALISTSKSVTDETMKYFDDVFLDVAAEGTDWFLEEEGNLLSDFRLDNIQNMRFGLSQKKYIFNEKTKASFLKILSYSTSIDKPKDETGKLMILRGNQTHWMLLGKYWVGIKTFQQKKYKYYSLKVDFTAAFKEQKINYNLIKKPR